MVRVRVRVRVRSGVTCRARLLSEHLGEEPLCRLRGVARVALGLGLELGPGLGLLGLGLGLGLGQAQGRGRVRVRGQGRGRGRGRGRGHEAGGSNILHLCLSCRWGRAAGDSNLSRRASSVLCYGGVVVWA